MMKAKELLIFLALFLQLMRLNVEASLGHDPTLDIGGTKLQLQNRNAGCVDLWRTYVTKPFPFTSYLNKNYEDIYGASEISMLQSFIKPGTEYTMVLTVSSTCPMNIEIGFSGKGGWFKTNIPANSNNVQITVTDTWEDVPNTRFENRMACGTINTYFITIHQIQLFKGSSINGNCVPSENEMYMVRDYHNDNKKCGVSSSSIRLWELNYEHATEEKCQEECAKDPNCVAVSGKMNSWCAGCKVGLTDPHQDLISFKKQTGQCESWPSTKKHCHGGTYILTKSLDRNIKTTAECEKLCLQNGGNFQKFKDPPTDLDLVKGWKKDGCCYVDPNDGCSWKSGATAVPRTAGLHINSKAVTCSFATPKNLNACHNIKIRTEKWGHENSYEIGTCIRKVVYSNHKNYEENCCLAPGTYTLKCKDSYGDGWHGGYLEIDGTKYCEDFKSGKSKSVTINFN